MVVENLSEEETSMDKQLKEDLESLKGVKYAEEYYGDNGFFVVLESHTPTALVNQIETMVGKSGRLTVKPAYYPAVEFPK